MCRAPRKMRPGLLRTPLRLQRISSPYTLRLAWWIGISSCLQHSVLAFRASNPSVAYRNPVSFGTQSTTSSVLPMAPKGSSSADSVPDAAVKRRRGRPKKSVSSSDDDGDSTPERSLVAKKAKSSKASPKGETASPKSPKKTTKKPSSPKSSKKKKPAHQVLTERDELPKLWTAEQAAAADKSYTMKIASWNVAGLRALQKKAPSALSDLVKEHDIDVLCLQEHKLQEIHLDDPKLNIRSHLLQKEGYDAYYTCSTTKKGYSGTAVFVKRRGDGKGKDAPAPKKKQKTMDAFLKGSSKETDSSESAGETKPAIDVRLLTPESVSYKLGMDKHDSEGRIVSVDFPTFSVINCYVPNSGQKLERLQYRLKEWDKDLLNFVNQKMKDRNVPVLWLGDLNVAHTNLEVWNDGARHLPKQAGVTPEERASFQAQLDSGFVDAFRHLHPKAQGHYSYWSQRAGNREPNKGLRLDYFICHQKFFDSDSDVIVRDSYILPDVVGSDHCPVVLELQIKT